MLVNTRVVVLSLSAMLCGCQMPPPQPPVMAQLPMETFKVNGESEVASEGLKVTLTPITNDNARGFPQIRKTITWNQTTTDSAGASETKTHSASINLAPFPAFQVRIANNTGHVVRLTTAVFRLENNVGKKWQTFSSTEELLAWTMSSLHLDPTNMSQITSQVQSAVGGLQLLKRSVELLKGDEWTGYLAFNLGLTTDSEYTDFMNNTERLTVRLAEIPVETNDAGQATKTTEFTFAVDKTTVQVAAVCPPGTAAPSWESGCKRQQ